MTLKEQALSLYQEVFSEDGEDFANSFTNRYFDNCCRYEVSDGKLVAMLYLLDCTILGEKTRFSAKYLYAATTHPDYRNKGLMSKLINRVLREENVIVTKPASEELFAFYKKFGFNVCSFKDDIKTSFKREEQLTCGQYIELRKKLLKNTPHIALSDEEFSLNGLTLYGNSSYCAAVDLETNTVKEYINEETLKSTKPFAMWTLNNKEPVYFGIAMD